MRRLWVYALHIPLPAQLQSQLFTDGEEQAVGLAELVPFLLASRLKELGAQHESGADFEPFVVRDERLVTGQNPVSAAKVAALVIEVLAEK